MERNACCYLPHFSNISLAAIYILLPTRFVSHSLFCSSSGRFAVGLYVSGSCTQYQLFLPHRSIDSVLVILFCLSLALFCSATSLQHNL